MKVKQPRRWKKRTAEDRRAVSRRTLGSAFWILFLLLGISALVISLTEPDSIYRREENTVSPSVFTEGDTALVQNVPLRNAMLRSVTGCIAGTGGSRIGNVYLTDDRLLECPEQLDVDAMSKTAEQINALYNKWEIPTCVIAVPPAGEFYADKMLKGLSYPSQIAEIDSFYQQILSPIRKIDAYHVLFTANEDYIYNRTDPRWSCYGAYCIYRTAIQKMGFAPISYDQFTITHAGSFYGSLYESCLYSRITPDILDIYTCKSEVQVTEMTAFLDDGTTEERQLYTEPAKKNADPYSFYLGECCEKLEIRTNLDNQKKLLLIKDSYADSMVPFLVQHYSEICILDITCAEHNLSELTDLSSCTQILFLCDADAYVDSETFSMLTEF